MKTATVVMMMVCLTGVLHALPAPPPLPEPRGGTRAASGADGTLYVIAGYDALHGPQSTVFAFTPGVDLAWRNGPALPVPLFSPGVASGPDGTIYCAGGVDAENTLRAEVYALLPGATAWISLPALPHERADFGCTVGLDGTVYAIGGSEPTRTLASTVYALEPGADAWVEKAPLPVPQGWFFPLGLYTASALTAADGSIYVMGGSTGGGTPDPIVKDAVYVYTPSTDVWTVSAPLPAARMMHAATTGSDGTLYVMGGADATDTRSTVFAFNPAVDTAWREIAAMPAPRCYMGAATGSDGTLYVLGGLGDNAEWYAHDSVYAFTPGVDDAWRTGDAAPPDITYESVSDQVLDFSSDPAVAQGLLDKLMAAQSAEERGNLKAKQNQLKAFQNQVRAQTGKSLTADEGAILLALIDQL